MWKRRTWTTKLLSRRIGLVICLAMIMLMALPASVLADAYPCAFVGTASIDGVRVDDGTTVTAYAENKTTHTMEEVGSTTTFTTGGVKGFFDLVAELDSAQHSTTIHFRIRGLDAAQTATWVQYRLVECNLTASTTAGGGGGGGGAGRDTTPPRISNVSLCPEGVTETTAYICWTTSEFSTSQVEYWSSPSKLTPLDETLVLRHQVHLTDLTPGTTYHYKTMSKDRADNLRVSDEYSLTTLGVAPEPAAFKPSSLTISPAEVDIGKAVGISILVANSGGESGSYEVILKIKGVVEETKEIDVAAGDSKQVSFSLTKDVAGSYEVDVNGLTGSFTVKEVAVAPAPPAPPAPAPPTVPPAPPPAPPAITAINWLVIGGIIGGVIVVGLVTFFLIRRRRA